MIDQKDIELLTNEFFEFHNGHIAMRFADSTGQFETAFIDCGAAHPRINETADNGGAETAGGNMRFEFSNPLLQKLSMQRTSGRFSQTVVRGGIDADRRL